jgi:transposase InsO family protein
MNEEPPKDPSSTYTPTPEVPQDLAPRLALILQVLSGVKTLAQAAREANLSRNHFQSLLNRSRGSMVQALAPQEPGRKPTPQALSELEQRLKRLERENSRLKKRVEATDELIMVAGELLHGQRRPGQRTRRVRKSESSEPDDAEPEPHEYILDRVDQMHRLGQSLARAAWLAGVDPSTVRRWRLQCARRKRPGRTVPASLSAWAEHLVRQLNGLIGAGALSHAVAGLSRRQAARIKCATLTLIERERQQTLTRVSVAAAGLIRGLDAMHLSIEGSKCYALVCADAAIPYRTSITLGEHYDAALVVHTLERDIDRHGAPLILRADRARAHDSPLVRKILEDHQVLMLHGPPRYPCFYGQLERQNREHRAWLDALINPQGQSMQALLEKMIYCLNTLWPRRSLGWKTASSAWAARSDIRIDRQSFKKEVQDRARHLERHIDLRAKPADLIERLAIEQTLGNLGHLHRQNGGWC